MGNAYRDAVFNTAFPSFPQMSGSTLKMVAGAIAERANDKNGTCWPSFRDIADHAQIDVKTVQDAVKWLAALGWHKVQRRVRDWNDATASNLYTPRPVIEQEVRRDSGKITTYRVFAGWSALVPGPSTLFAHPWWPTSLGVTVAPPRATRKVQHPLNP